MVADVKISSARMRGSGRERVEAADVSVHPSFNHPSRGSLFTGLVPELQGDSSR